MHLGLFGGGGKTICYEVFAAMAATVGWSTVFTAQTNAGTAAVGGDKCPLLQQQSQCWFVQQVPGSSAGAFIHKRSRDLLLCLMQSSTKCTMT